MKKTETISDMVARDMATRQRQGIIQINMQRSGTRDRRENIEKLAMIVCAERLGLGSVHHRLELKGQSVFKAVSDQARLITSPNVSTLARVLEG